MNRYHTITLCHLASVERLYAYEDNVYDVSLYVLAECHLS